MIDIVKALEVTKLNTQSDKNSYKDVNKSTKEKFSEILSNKNSNEDEDQNIKSGSDDRSEESIEDEKVDTVDTDKNVIETDSKKAIKNEEKNVDQAESVNAVKNEDEKITTVSVDELLELQTLIADLINQLNPNGKNGFEISSELKTQLENLTEIQMKISELLSQVDKGTLKSELVEILKKMDTVFNDEKINFVIENSPKTTQNNILSNSQKLEAIISEIAAKVNGEVEEKTIKVDEKSSMEFKLTSDEDEKDLEVLKSLVGDQKKPIIQNNFYNKLASLKNAQPVNQTVRANYMEQDIVKNVKFMTTNDIKELTIKVVPKELGELAIKLVMDSGIMKAKITAVNKDAYNLIQNNSANIMEKLNENDIKIQNVEVSIYQEDALFHKDGEKESAFNQQFSNSKKKIDYEVEDDIETAQDIDEEYNIHALA